MACKIVLVFEACRSHSAWRTVAAQRCFMIKLMLGNILFFASLRLSTTLKKFILEVLYFCYFWNCLQRQFSICKRKFIFFIIVTLGFLTQGGFTTITVFNQHHLDTALNDIRLFPKKSNPLPKIRHLTIDKQKNLSQTILANNY